MGIPERPLDTPDGNAAVPGTTAPGTVGILGLGLIGGSFARAYARAGWRVLAYDVSDDVMDVARVETVSGVLEAETAATCDLIV